MTYHFKHRAISLLLAFALLLSMMPGGVLPVHSVESESNETVDTESVSTKEFDHLIDRVATFSEYYDTFMLAPLPSKVTGYENVQWSNAVNYSVYDYIGDDSALSDDEYYALYDAFYAIKLVIKECYISAESHGALWFRVEAAEGETLPEIFQENPWIFAFYSGFEGEDKNIALNVRHADLLTSVYVEGAPEDTELVVEVPTLDGEALPGVFDIKMYDEDGNEWQPIDEGKTVTISIPVEGDIATVTHFVDYAGAIHDGLTFESVADADEAVLELLKPAIDAYEEVYGNRDCVALEILEEIPIVDGVAAFEASSFSIWSATGDTITQKALFINIGEGTDNGQVAGFAAAVFENGVWNNGLYYIPTTGGGMQGKDGIITIQAAWQDVAEENNYAVDIWDGVTTEAKITVSVIHADGNIEILLDKATMTSGRTGEIKDGDYRRGIALYNLSIADAQISDRYYVTVEDGEGNIATIQFIVADLDTDEYTMTFEDPYSVLDEISSDNPVTYVHADKVAIPAATAIEGYTFTHWILREPAGQWENIKYYPGDEFQYKIGNVVFIPQVTPNYKYVVYFVSDVAASGVPAGIDTGWLSDSTYTVTWDTTPVAEDSEHYTFMGWSVSTGGTLTEYDQQLTVTGTPASTITVTLTAVWQHNDDKAYTVEHYYETLESGVYELVEVETLYGVEGNNTAAKANNPVGFTAPATVTQEVITGDTTVVKIYYTRNTYNATWYIDGVIHETVPYKYGATIEVPKTADGNAYVPEKTGYVFDRWEGYTEGMTMPASNWGFNALWNLATLAIYFDSNGGSSVAPIIQPYLSTVTAPTPPEKTGYTFAGWYTDQKCTAGNEYSFDDNKTMPATSLTLYAKWDINSYKLTYESIFGLDSNKFTEQTITYMDVATIHAEIPVQEGYTFLGWMCDIDGCATCSSKRFHGAGTTFTMPADDVTLTAQWDPTPFTLTYTGEGVTEVTSIHYYGESVTIKENPEREGYTFQGWKCDVPGCDAIHVAGSTFSMPATHVIFTAQWTANDYTYNVVYKSSTGIELGSTTVTKKFGTTNTIAPPDFTGYTTPAAQSVTWDSTTAKTITFVYNPIEYSLTINYQYEGGGQAAATYTGSVAYGATYSVTSPSITGYTPDKATVSGTMGAGNVEVTVTYMANTYSVKFDANGGSSTMANQSFTYGVAQALTANGFTRTGYTFAGWNTAADGSGTSYTNGQSVSNLTSAENGIVTLYAQWTTNQYTITFVANGGSEVGSVLYDINTDLTLPAAPTRVGYVFDGWIISSGGGNWNTENTYWGSKNLGTGYYGNIALTAQWKANSYTVTFNSNSGDGGAMSNQTFTYDEEKALTANGFTRTGYTFAGWNTAANGSGTSYTNGQSVSNLTSTENGTVTLYAQWTINQHTVNVDYDSSMVTVTINGVEVTDSSDYYFDYGAHVTITITPKDGYTIETVTQNDASWGTIVESGHSETIEVKGNIKIVATAKLKTYTVTYNLGFHYNADVTSNQTEFPNQTKTHGQPLTLHNQNPVATGAVFAGWDINGDNVKDYGVGDTIELNQNVTLTALWEPEPYQVTYMVEGLANGQTITIDSQAGFYKNTITLTIPSVVGYTLTTKSAISGGNVVSIDGDGKIVMPAGDVVVTLTYAPNSYTVTFNNNGGDGDMANQTFAYDEEKALTANGFTRTGYTFAGWNTATDGSGTTYGDGQSVKNLSASGTVTLYAQWNVETYNITYDLAGGTVSGNPATYTVESGVITLVNPAKIGYTFAGWTGTGLDGATMDVTIPAGSTGNRSYTATWTPNTDTEYTVYHYLQNLDGSSYALYLTQPLTGTTGASVTPALQTPVGFTAPSAQTVIISADGSTVVKYYYTRNSYQMTWNVDGVETKVDYAYGATIDKPADPTKTGYAFNGWTPAVPATMPAENLTFTATWTTNEYTVTWDVDGATTTETYEYGATIVKPADPVKEGHTFAGWTPAVPGTMPAENLIFTAQWTVNQYTVTFVLGNGQPDIVQTYAYGASVTAPGAPSRAGYTFGGWDTSVPATMPAENLTFTATWTEILQTLTVEKHVHNIGHNELTLAQTFTFVVTLPDGKTYAEYRLGMGLDYATELGDVQILAGENANQFKIILTITATISGGDKSNPGTLPGKQPLVFKISGLPLGAYTVVEEPKEGFEAEFGAADSNVHVGHVTLEETGNAELVIFNTYPVYVGDLTITKTVNPAFSGDAIPDQDFTFTILLTPHEYALSLLREYDYSYTVTDENGSVKTDATLIFADGQKTATLTITLRHGQSVTFEDLPTGQYSIVETVPDGYTHTPPANASGTIYSDSEPDETPVVDFVNTWGRTTGTLKVEKTIDNIGTVAAEAEERTFTFRVTLPVDVTKDDFIAKYTAGDITWSADERSFTFTIIFTSAVAAGATVSKSKVFANVPSGDYEVAEIDTPVGFVPIVSPVTAEVRSGAEATATFVNQYPVYLITYQVVGEGGTVTVSGNNGVSVSEKVNKNAAAVGATANAAEGYRFVGWFSDSGCTGTPLSTALTYAPTKPDAGWSENLTVYAKFEPIGSLTIEKVVNNKDDADLTNQSFTFTVTMPGGKKVADYVAVGGAVTAIDSANNSFTVTITIATVGANATASSKVTLNGLPMGTYTVKETGIAFGFVSDWDGDTTTVTLSGATASVTATCTNEYPVYRVDYIVEGPGGTVKLKNVAGNAASVYEIYNFVTGAPAGATATAANGYQFDGWYLDGVRVSTELTFIPEKAEENRVYKARFKEITAPINFVIVDPNGNQFTADTDWVKLTTYSATIGSATGDISSTVTDLSVVYKFMGWYSDSACTNKLSDELTYTPQKIDDLHVAATYYAKFAYNLTSLDITVQLATPLDEDQSFVLYLTDNATGNKLTVSVHVPASSTTGTATIMGVTVGHSYTVTLDSNWAWRYDNDPTWAYESVSSGSGFAASFTAEVDGTLSFIVAPSDNQWLDGYDWLDQWLNGTP